VPTTTATSLLMLQSTLQLPSLTVFFMITFVVPFALISLICLRRCRCCNGMWMLPPAVRLFLLFLLCLLWLLLLFSLLHATCCRLLLLLLLRRTHECFALVALLAFASLFSAFWPKNDFKQVRIRDVVVDVDDVQGAFPIRLCVYVCMRVLVCVCVRVCICICKIFSIASFYKPQNFKLLACSSILPYCCCPYISIPNN